MKSTAVPTRKYTAEKLLQTVMYLTLEQLTAMEKSNSCLGLSVKAHL